MNDFERMFPDIAERTRRAKEDMTALRKNTNSWRCEARLWPLLDAFVAYFPSRFPVDKQERSTLYAGARKLMRRGVTERNADQFIRDAVNYMRRQHVESGKDMLSNVKNLHSLDFFTGHFKPDKYTTGLMAEYMPEDSDE